MKHGELLNKHFCKKISNIPNDLAEIVNFHFSHYKSMGTISCHSNQSSYPTEIKTRIDVYETLCPNRCLYIKVAKLRTGVGSAEMSHLQNRCLKISG